VTTTPNTDPRAAELRRRVEGQIARTGKRYDIKLETLDASSLENLSRLIRDLSDNADDERRKRRLGRWF